MSKTLRLKSYPGHQNGSKLIGGVCWPEKKWKRLGKVKKRRRRRSEETSSSIILT
jgi:hypothetical protein